MEPGIRTPIVYVLSDAAGETGEAVVRAAAIQFYPIVVEIRRMPFIHERSRIDEAVEAAHAGGGVIVFTLVVPELRDYLIEMAFRHQVVTIDLLGPVIGSLEKALNKPSRHEPGLIHKLDDDYFRKVEAVEFAVKYDDGKDARGLLKADIVLVGVSRTSKTPLSMYLAHKGFKVANVPLVPELPPPRELFAISAGKIVGLRISVAKLNEIRVERVKAIGLPDNASYANVQRIEQELAYADSIVTRLGCLVIDVSNKAVEETASLILGTFGRRE